MLGLYDGSDAKQWMFSDRILSLQVISITIVSFLMLPLICLLKGMDYFILTPLKDLPAVLQIPASLAVDLILLVKNFNKQRFNCAKVTFLFFDFKSNAFI